MCQVREAIVAVGWAQEPIYLGGKSLGGATVMHYVLNWGNHVARLVLICPAGAPEAEIFMMPHFGRAVAKIVYFILKLIHFILPLRWLRYCMAHMRLLHTTPEYRIPEDSPERIAAVTQVFVFQVPFESHSVLDSISLFNFFVRFASFCFGLRECGGILVPDQMNVHSFCLGASGLASP
eukprot:c11109_g1_i2.p1 GENE.c11109_g1_i2~~c11109_g1_i2.p1  ORF type:complete len:179 (+),score=17.39 c11109_g1_i2:296-832(+)